MKLLKTIALLSLFTLAGPAFAGALDNPLETHLKNLRQLTFEGDNGEAYFSFDGKKLIFQSSRGGKGCDRIYTMNADGTDISMVSPDKGANTCSYFLPGGEKIVYSSTSALPGDCPERIKIPGQNYVWPLWPYDIYIADSDGRNVKALTDNPEYDAEPVVNAAGTRIVFGSKRGGDFDVYTMNMDGGDVKRLTTEYGYDGGPWWSPDGSMIAWRAYYPSTEAEKASWKDSMDKNYIVPVPLDLWVMKSDGTEKRRIVSNGAVNWAPSWHPDGKRLVFSSNMDDWKESQKRFGHNFELYMVDIDGKNLKRLTYNDNFDSFPMFSPDGRKLIFGSNRTKERPRQTDIFIADWEE